MLSKTYLHGYLNQKHIFINMNYKNFKICCNFCPRYIEMFQASVIAEKSWTKVNKNGWKNSFWKFPTEKFIWIQLLELLTDQNEAAIFGYSIKFYVKIELANCVRHLWDHSNVNGSLLHTEQRKLHYDVLPLNTTHFNSHGHKLFDKLLNLLNNFCP